MVGWAHGRSEFGPRALGNRSILADARPVENRDRINAMVKKREGFRPFAPAVTPEAAAAYFDLTDTEAVETARGIWAAVNGPNLRTNIAPTRSRARLVLQKAADHSVRRVLLRKL